MPERPKKTAPRFSAAARRKLAETLAPSEATSLGELIGRRAERGAPAALTTSQERLWLSERVLGSSPLYHVPFAAHLVGALDPAALGRALDELVRRHDVLRARFVQADERAEQHTLPAHALELAPVDLSELPSSQRYARALALAREEFRRPFELERGPPLRAALWRLSADEHVLLLALHHLVCDGATMRILCDELAELYAAEREGRACRLPEPELQHGDYAAWQRNQAEGAEARAGLDHFAERLHGPIAPLELPTDRARPAQRGVRGAWRTRRMEAALGASLAELARAHGATPFQLFLAAFHALLARLTGQTDLVVGIPIGMRERPELERLPGFLVNTLALRTRLDGAPTFVELLARVRDTALEAYAHRAAPFERVLERVRPARDPGRAPLFDVMFDHRESLPDELRLVGLASGRLIPEDQLHSGTSKVDLALYTALSPTGFSVSAEFRSDLFDPGTIDLWLERFETMLRALAGNPHARLDELELLGANERGLLQRWSLGPAVSGCETTIHACMAEHAARTPEKVALEHGALRVTYAELEERSNRLARALEARGVTRGEPVALCLARTDELVVALLGILKSGGAYLPLDPNYPCERLRFMLRDSGARVLVTEAALADALPADELDVLCLERERAALARLSAAPTAPCAGAGDPAYLIYTSGSTGTPKGVACPHRGVLRLFKTGAQRGAPGGWGSAGGAAPWLVFDERVRMLHVAPESFDASVLDTWGPLLCGGTLVLHPERVPTLDGLARVVAEHAIDTLFLTTALFHALVDEAPATLAGLRQVATGGEALSLAHLRRARELCPALAISNCYGPTEATVIATTWVAPAELAPELAAAPIGAPIANTSVRVLDERLRPVPVGVAGELFVGGPSIALGYWKRPELTRERFMNDPLESGTLYRTGDRVRWRNASGEGVLEFLGRRDDQVKIRGHRIELGEVEARLSEHPSVRRALVVAREDVPGSKRLVAYVVPGAERPSTEALAAHLAERLPEYLRPAAIVLLDELPITPGGKVDRARLPAPGTGLAPARREAPRGATEELLAGLWCELLELPAVGRDDDFFELGGHSLAATILSARIKKHLGQELALATLFRERTLANLARGLDAARLATHRRAGPRPCARGGTPLPVAPNQRGLWFLQQLAPASAVYNVPFALPLAGPLDAAALARSLAEIVARHEALRTRFPLHDGMPVQVVEAPFEPLETLDLRHEPDVEEAARAALAELARQSFDLERGPLFRARLVRAADERAWLGVCVHHIVFDGWSFDVFVDELTRLYAAFARNEPSPLQPLALQCADHAAWLAEQEDGEHARAALEFWKRALEGAPPALELATDHPRPARPSWRGAKVQRALPRALIERLCAMTRAEGATPYLALLSVAQVLLARYAGVQDLVIGTPVAARTEPECERLLGLFLNVVAIRADLAGAPSFRELLARTRARVLDAHAHGDFPFERLVEALDAPRDPAVTPVYQVLFSLRRASAPRTVAGLVFEPALELDAGGAKTDLAITIEERAGDWLLDLSFATDLFDPATLERFGEHFENLLAAALAEPARPVWELELLGPTERARLLEEWSGAAPSYPRDLSLAVLFERAAARQLDDTALVLGDETLTYRALNARANRLARKLVALGVGRDARVGLCAERSFEMIVALLAIVKAGGAYVPLDPAYPAERLAFMLADAGVQVLLVDAALTDSLSAPGVTHVVLDELDLSAYPDDDLPARSGGGDLAYVMYTSGSTGRPKGVAIPQRGISRLVLAADFARLDRSRTLLALAPISFDASTLEIWGALLCGARLVLYPERVPTAEDLERVLLENGVTTLWLTAALFNSIVDERPRALRGLAECLTGGEALSVAHVRRAQAELPPSVQLINGYGPTENTTFTCCHRIPRPLPADAGSIPIGRPIANTTVYVVDARLGPVPIGVPGELVTGGDGLARGYLGRPELDAERFVANPFGPGKLYRTGDRARWLASGVIEFLGRTDDQVKIRGHRIEPGEIATLLGAHPAVRKAFVSVHESPAAGKQLVGYFEARDGAPPAASALAAWLAERLPEYMVPVAFVHLEALPMNPNGKVDRKRLPEPGFESRSAQRPRNEVEGLLASLWEKVLDVQGVGPEDDFFELGGHSLLAVKLVQAIHDAFGQELELAALIAAPTLAAQAQLLHSGVGSRRSGALVKLQPQGTRTPVFCVCSLGGTVLNQRPLALLLGEDQPFYGLQAIDLDAELGRSATIEDYAAAYVAALKKAAPRGPYVIGGHSFGGIVSFEIAQQLTSRGDEVAMLFILDSSLPNLDRGALDRLAGAFAFLRGLPYLPGEALNQLRRDPEQLARALRQKLRFVAGKAKPAPPRPAEQGGQSPPGLRDVVEMSHWPENNRRIAERHWRAVLAYRPKHYPGRVTLFRSRFQSPFLGLGNTMGWDRVALGGVDVVRVPGGHLTVLQPPNVQVLARHFRERLERRRRAA